MTCPTAIPSATLSSRWRMDDSTNDRCVRAHPHHEIDPGAASACSTPPAVQATGTDPTAQQRLIFVKPTTSSGNNLISVGNSLVTPVPMRHATGRAFQRLEISAGENPGLISDVLVVTDEFLKSKPGQVLALVKAWDAAVADYRKDTPAGRAIISEAVGAKPDELTTAFDGVVYYSAAENKAELGGSFTTKVIPEVHKAARAAGILQQDVDLTTAIDARFVNASG